MRIHTHIQRGASTDDVCRALEYAACKGYYDWDQKKNAQKKMLGAQKRIRLLQCGS